MAHHTILLVDYEPRSTEQMRRSLETAGYRVEIARDGVAGAERFEDLKPDLVLVEAMIPKKHGFDLCLDLKRTPHGQRTPVLIITGVYKGRKYRTQATHHYRCDAFLEKPISAEDLLAAIRQHLERSRPAAEGFHATEEEILGRLDAVLPDPPAGSVDSPARTAKVPVAVRGSRSHR